MIEIETSNSPSCRTNRPPQNKTYKVDANDSNANMLDYFRYSTNRAADKKASKGLTKKINNEIRDVFQA